MEARELRVGNWVNWNGENGVISQILEHKVVFKCGEDTLMSELKPIPLTEEILLKCGFVKRGDFWFDNDKLTIDKCSYDDVINVRYRLNAEESIFICELKHLHQLQNLYFALTNEELTINL